MIKTAVIGYGFSATIFHLPFISSSDNYNLVAISTSKVKDAKQKYPHTEVYQNAQELIQQTDARLIVITAPNDVHFKLAKECLQCGKHVILEKPMVITTMQAEKLMSMAHKNNRILSVYHNRRWDGDFLTVQELIRNNTLGNIRFFESHFDRFRPVPKKRWRELSGPGSGTLYDLGAHLIDQTLYLFGMPDALTARCLNMRDNARTTDYFHLQLHYPEFEVILHGSSLAAGPNLRFHIQGTKGSFIKYGYDPQEKLLKSGKIPGNAEWIEHYGKQKACIYTNAHKKSISILNGNYMSYYNAIADAINFGKSLPVKAEEGLNVIKLIELAYESSKLDKTIKITS